VYDISFAEATQKQDTNSLDAHAALREQIDELREFRMEDLTGPTKEERDWHPDTGEDEAMLGDDDEDMAAMYEAMSEEHKEELAGMDLETRKQLLGQRTRWRSQRSVSAF
jgi:hypothetical protein